MKKRILAWVFSVAMAVALLPGAALADGEVSSPGSYGPSFTLTPENSAGLSALEVSAGTLSPAFDAKTMVYTVRVEGTVTSIRVKPTAAAGATVAAVTANGQEVIPSGGWYTVNLNGGESVIQIMVAGNGDTLVPGSYILTVTRDGTWGGSTGSMGDDPVNTPGDGTEAGGGDSGEGSTDETGGTFDIAVEVVENGGLRVSAMSAREGALVAVVPIPDEGYKTRAVTVTDGGGNPIQVAKGGDGSWSFLMPAGQVVVGATFRAILADNPFADVSATAYYYDPVMWAVDEEITAGTTGTTFGPNDGCTRAQIITFIWRAEGSPEPTGGSLPFTDVKETDYYCKAVLWAVENGITSGTTDTTFSPGGLCTRAQAVTLLWKAEGSPAADSPAGYGDVAGDAYYAAAVDWAVERGVTQGVSGTAFAPGSTCTRAQIITFLYRTFAG